MKKLIAVVAFCGVMGTAGVAAADYHVYKLGNGECEVDQRDHSQMKSQRGTDKCFGHFSSRSSAQDLRTKKVKAGECKCPSGQNC